MSEPRKVTQDEYDILRSKMEDKYGYDDMSDEEKERFDAKMDEVAVVEKQTKDKDKHDEADKTEATDNKEGPKKVSQEEYDKFRDKMEKKYGYDKMSDEEKERFDATIDKVAVVDKKTDADNNDEEYREGSSKKTL